MKDFYKDFTIEEIRTFIDCSIGDPDSWDSPVWSGHEVMDFFKKNPIAKEDLTRDIVEKLNIHIEVGVGQSVPYGIFDYLDSDVVDEKLALEARNSIMSTLTGVQREAELDALEYVSEYKDVIESRGDMWEAFFTNLYESAIYHSFKEVNGYTIPFDFDEVLKEREEIKRIGIEAFEKAERITRNRMAGAEKARKTRADKIAEELFFAGLALGGS
jgi:hypothetical protein